MNGETSICPGCRLELAGLAAPTHAYIGASPACWALYGELLAREFGEGSYGRLHRLSVDAYAVQHPGRPERRSIQSLGLHLMGLCLVLEHGVDPERTTRLLRQLVESRPSFRWLEPPQPNGTVTVADVLEAGSPEEHLRRVDAWAHDVWDSWTLHHPQVRQWLDASLG